MQLRIKKFRQNIILRSITAAFILCTFMLSITPKQVLHSVSADHTDQPSKKINDRLQFNQVGFNCDCNSIVATSPFTDIPAAFEISKLVHYSFYNESSTASFSSSDRFYFTLRGPPSLI